MEAYSICPPQNGVGTGDRDQGELARRGRAGYGGGRLPGVRGAAGRIARERQLQRRRDPAARLLVGRASWPTTATSTRGTFHTGATTAVRAAASAPRASRSSSTCPSSATAASASRRAASTPPAATPRRARSTPPTARSSRPRTWSSGCRTRHCPGSGRTTARSGPTAGTAAARRPGRTSRTTSAMMSTRIYADGALAEMLDFRDPSLPEWARCDFTRRKPCKDFDAGRALARHRRRSPTASTRARRGGRRGRQRARDRPSDPGRQHGARKGAAGVTRRAAARAGGPANDFTVAGSNPPGQVAPIARAHYELCGDGGCTAGSVRGRRGIDGLSRLASRARRVLAARLARGRGRQRGCEPGQRCGRGCASTTSRRAPCSSARIPSARPVSRSPSRNAAPAIADGRDRPPPAREAAHGTSSSASLEGARRERRGRRPRGCRDGVYELRAHARDARRQRAHERPPARRVQDASSGFRFASPAGSRCRRCRPRCGRRGRHRKRRCRPPAGAGATLVVKRRRAHALAASLRTAGGEPIAAWR